MDMMAVGSVLAFGLERNKLGNGVDFKGTNKTYRGNGNDVADVNVFTNGKCIVIAHELSDEELEEIVRTRKVFSSSLSGSVLYPIFVGSESAVRSVVVDYGNVW